jgi:hypothetical protein
LPHTLRITTGSGHTERCNCAHHVRDRLSPSPRVSQLLSGEMPTDIEDVFAALGLTLFPAGVQELSLDCSCPDGEVPCKHLAATLFLLAESFDADPFAILALRGRSRDGLLDNLRARRGGAPPAADQHGPGAGAIPLAECLGTFFLATPQPACPPPAATPTDAVLDQLPGIAVTVCGQELGEPAPTGLPCAGWFGSPPMT